MTANSIRRLAGPREALLLLSECLVLTFTYVESRRRFCLVSDFPEKALRSDRAFSAFVFDGVTEFAREEGDLEKFFRFKNAYSATEDERPIVVQSVHTLQRGSKSVVQFWFGPNFGGLKFSYENVSVFVRDAQARQVGSSFVYSDVATGEEFALTNPFAEFNTGTDGTIQ